MKKNFRFLALSAAILSMFTACQREELDQNQNPEGLTHTVTFLAGDAGTKTIVDISDGKTAKFSFTEGDIDRITIWENGVKGTVDKKNSSVENGIMTITATFAGEKTEENKTYTAVLNTSSISTQIVSSNSYDEDADVLVAKPVTTAASGIKFQFKREVAIAKMTLKGLDAGENINYVSISSSSEAGFAGSFDGKEWISTASSIDIASQAYMEEGEYIITANASGEAEVWFTCIPQTDATLTVTVESADGDTYTKEFRNPITLTRGDVKGFGVAMKKDAKGLTFDFVNHPSGWKTSSSSTNNVGTYYYSLNGTDFSFTSDGDIYCGGASATSGYLMIKSGCHLGLPSLSGYRLAKVIGTLNDSGTPSTKSSVSITDSYSKTVEGGDAQIWNSKGASFTYTLLNTDENAVYYLSPTSANLQVIKLVLTYEPAKARTVLTAPTNLAVSADKVVSWDAVDGAASYVLTIGSAKFTCETNSHTASEIADEYYDVAVVAVPSDTENYKNSDAATLTDAKFGTPTLSTPEITPGVIEETSVAFSWTKDTRATSGYHWALYNGETLIKEATETSATSVAVTSLGFGTTYTAKVYAIAVDGDKPYAQSAIATLDLTTKAKTTISTIVNAGTGTTKYAISDLTVMAVSGSNFVVKDDTGLMFCYKSGASAGQIVTLEGTYEDYQGLKEFKATTYTKTTTATVEHGIPYELNASNASAYVTNPVVQYVKANATVASDGSLKIGDVAVYQYGNSLSSYAGRTINLYGYTLGYNTSKSNIVLIQTSVEIDETVPYLAIDQTSKTWESDETNAAVFKVTTNTEGEKDWTVSPETLEWATIEVAAGTITVTPTSSNDTETARVATLTVSHSAGTLSEKITLTQKGKGATTPASITINSKTENFPSSYGTANKFAEYTLNGLKYMIQQIYVSGEKLQWRASGNKNGTGTMYNSEEMPAGIASIVITYNSSDDNKNHTVKTGASANPTSATSITPTMQGNVYTYSCDGTSKYFVITNGTGAGYIDSIVINFK